MRFLQLISTIIFYLLMTRVALAAGFGSVAGNLLGPVDILSDFMSSASIIIGMMCCFACFIRYMQHRVNPLAYPLSTVVMLGVIGIVLLLLPFVYLLTESGVQPHVPRL